MLKKTVNQKFCMKLTFTKNASNFVQEQLITRYFSWLIQKLLNSSKFSICLLLFKFCRANPGTFFVARFNVAYSSTSEIIVFQLCSWYILWRRVTSSRFRHTSGCFSYICPRFEFDQIGVLILITPKYEVDQKSD